MALLNKLKSILGIGGGRDGGDQRTNTSVTVEREASDTTAESVADSGNASTAAETQTDEDDSVAAGTDAAASTGSITETSADDPETAAEPGEAASPPSEPTDPPSEPVDEQGDRDVDALVDEAEPAADTDDSVAAETDAAASTESLAETENPEPEAAAEPGEAAGPPTGSPDALDGEESVDEPEEPTTASGEPVDTIKGIGPAYSDRLSEAGVESVSALAAADAEELGEAIDVSPKIVADWIDRAGDN